MIMTNHKPIDHSKEFSLNMLHVCWTKTLFESNLAQSVPYTRPTAPKKEKDDNYNIFTFFGFRIWVVNFGQRFMLCQLNVWQHNMPFQISVLIVALSLIVFSVWSVCIGFGRRVADVRVVYVILHTSRLPNKVWWTAFYSTTGRCVCSCDFLMRMCISAPWLRMSTGYW